MTGGEDIARAFSDAHASGTSELLSTYLDAVAEVLAEHKRETIEAMDLRSGDAGLDVGCGVGDEVRLSAERVGASGRAVGVDVNEGLLATARERTPQHVQVAFIPADAHALPFADGEFTAARIERALQHMTDPSGAVVEMARVVRPGGRVVALEPDWETLVVSSRSEQTTRAIRDDLLARTASPTVGRNLARYLADAGLVLETVQARTLVVRDAATATRLFLLDDAAKRVGTDAGNQWLADLSGSTPEGGFCAALTQFAVIGTRARPDPHSPGRQARHDRSRAMHGREGPHERRAGAETCPRPPGGDLPAETSSLQRAGSASLASSLLLPNARR